MPRCGAGGPCVWIRALSQPQRHGRKPWRGVRVVVLLLHALFIGAVFLLDPTLQRQIHEAKWYDAEPEYRTPLIYAKLKAFVIKKRQANSKSGSLNSAMSRSKIDQQNPQSTTALLLQQTMDLYPPGTSTSCMPPFYFRDFTCSYCRLIQPPRTKHCHDCDKCVLQFDHHCVWLGTCIAKRNYCRFWWYIFEQTVLTVWTVAFYIQFFYLGIVVSWWKFAIGIVLLVALILILVVLLPLLIFHAYLALTNQTTYEIARRKRISYLREVPSRVHPFSKGICRNLYDLCISKQRGFFLEAVPPLEVLQARARPYTCRDVISCRCC
uniref:S-acyltransferase n=1 Tax=Oryza nivara TaxID=4536 RepID=A0A0E0H4B2_ORYNI